MEQHVLFVSLWTLVALLVLVSTVVCFVKLDTTLTVMEPVCYAIIDFQDVIYAKVENVLHVKQTISIIEHQQQETV
jgi:hypothetical protein